VLAGLPKIDDPNLLVGFATNDDAGIYRLNEEIALITTADFITPPVNDPHIFGQIAAANAISDVYAMGGRPIACLNLAGFPSKKLDIKILQKIIVGALSKITEAGAVLAGGHTIEDDEPKFGLAVSGIVHPDKYWTNNGAKSGDVLILTKPIGSGVLFNANLKRWVSQEAMDECIAMITMLNKTAAEIIGHFKINAVTDVTGFGLAGHCFEMALASNVQLEVNIDDVPLMRESLAMYEKGMRTGMNSPNRQMVEKHMVFKKVVPPWHQEIVYDPQTSGGLLVAVPRGESEKLLEALRSGGVKWAEIIGDVNPLQDSTHLVFG
jgi:selenide,water dikinase